MSKPSDELVETLRWIATEIGAGKVLIPITLQEQAHNNACERAIQIIQNYREGYGLFQMTRKKPENLEEAKEKGHRDYLRATGQEPAE